jgi:hypothetical protein
VFVCAQPLIILSEPAIHYDDDEDDDDYDLLLH